MVQVTIGTETEEFPQGTTWAQIAAQYQEQYENDILLVQINGKLQELHKTVRSGNVHFITAEEKPGMSAYQRSATLLLLKALYAAAGPEQIEKAVVDFSVGKGFFVEARGSVSIDQPFLDRVKAKMREYVDQELPIEKRSVSTDDAVELFHRHRMYDKERLFRYRRVSRVNIYSIDGFEDYYYGYMVPNTKYLKYFDLKLYQYGFVLLLPTMTAPREIPPFVPQDKLFATLAESSRWGRQADLETVGALNDTIPWACLQRHGPPDPDSGGASGKEDRRDRRQDCSRKDGQVCYDCRPLLFWKDHVFPSPVHTAGGARA